MRGGLVIIFSISTTRWAQALVSGPEPDVRLSKAVDLSKARNCDHFQSSTHSRRSAWGWCGAFWGDEGELPLWRLIYLATIEGVQEIFFANLKSTLTRRSFEVCLWDLHHDLSFPKEFFNHNNLWKDWGGRWESRRGWGSWRSILIFCIFHVFVLHFGCFFSMRYFDVTSLNRNLSLLTAIVVPSPGTFVP